MGLKILHSADWHLDSPFTGFTPEQRLYLREELNQIPGKIAELCRREGCDLMLLSGDIFDGPYSRESLELVRAALEKAMVPVFIAPGNHDYVGPGSPWIQESWPTNVHIFTGGLSSMVIPELNCRVYGAGYRSMDCPALLDNFRAVGDETYMLGVLHGDPMTLRSPYCPVTAAQVRDSDLDYLALGHIHKAGSFRARGRVCGWPGAPMGRGFDEKREKGVYIVEIGEETNIRFFPLDTPRFYEEEVDLSHQDPEELLPAMGSRNFYRLILTGFGGPSLEELRRRLERFPNLELIDQREDPADPWARAGDDTLEGTYLRLLQEKLNDQDPETAEAVLLAARISRMLLEGKEVTL